MTWGVWNPTGTPIHMNDVRFCSGVNKSFSYLKLNKINFYRFCISTDVDTLHSNKWFCKKCKHNSYFLDLIIFSFLSHHIPKK